MTTAAPFDPLLLSRIEDAGINASAPREQRWVDGWLLRLSPGEAKRARSIQPVAPGRLGIDEKLAICLPLYAEASLQAFVRITPFSQPQGLDHHLEARGMMSIAGTRVMVLASLDEFAGDPSSLAGGGAIAPADPAAFAEFVGRARGSSEAERRAHAERIGRPAVPHHGVLARDPRGAIVAAGQVVMESGIAGLYDVLTREAARRQGHAERLCRHLLAYAASQGAGIGYLQVDAGNEAARRIYRRLGFVDAYSYHYRTPGPAAEKRAD